MQLDHDRCYTLLTARDARFDGRFFTGVLTTGIYCRPICPARTPKSENVHFYQYAAAAEAAGFRPCRRCRPDAAPGTPAWHGSSSTVRRALRLIADGALDDGRVDALASRLGLGERQLRRLFNECVGVGPLAVAKTRRAHFARRLIDATTLPMAEIASAAGYRSVRQFNDQIRETFQRSPTEIRRGAGDTRATSSARALELKLPHREPLDWEGLCAFLEPRAIPGVELVCNNVFRRVCLVDDDVALVEIVCRAGGIVLRYHGPVGPGLMRVVERARRLLDLDADPAQASDRLRRDPALAPLIARHPGLRVPGAWDPFEASVRAILGQQVSVRGATTIAGRIVREYGTPVPREIALIDGGGEITHLFPTAAVLAGANVAPLGMPGKRAETVRSFAAAVAEGTLVLDGTQGLDEATRTLLALPGIGPWTAQYIAMRALAEPDAFPTGDLGLRKAWAALRGVPKVSDRELESAAENWRPWRAYAVMHLWASLA